MVHEHDYIKFPELRNSQLAEEEFNSPHPQIKEDFTATVIRVHDGDTVRLITEFRDFDFPLRLLDIDAPELNDGGEEAGNWLRDRVLGQKVLIIMDRNRRVGKFGRLLGKIFYQGLDVGSEMLNLGLVAIFGQLKPQDFPDLSKNFNLRQWF